MNVECVFYFDHGAGQDHVGSEFAHFEKIRGDRGQPVLHEQSIQLIFLDIQMPDLSGMELAKALSQTNASMNTRII